MKKVFILGAIMIVLLVGLRFLNNRAGSETSKSGALKGFSAVVYKSPTCGCCGNYAQYLRRNGVTVDVRETTDMPAVKQKFGIPKELESCHTTQIGGYTVEGHIPVAAIEKLLSDKPNSAGIAMAGMPQGSPGMPGVKDGPWDISEFSTSTSSSSLFMSI